MEGKALANSSTRLVYYLLLAQFLAQFVSFFYLYVNMTRLESRLDSQRQLLDCDLRRMPPSSSNAAKEGPSRRKRSSAIPAAEDNAVSEVFRSRDVKDSFKDTKGIPQDIEFIWMPGNTRVSREFINDICREARSYCSPGEPGIPGIDGVPGPKGDPGLPGREGSPGMPGPRGPPGPEGPRGAPGVDGVAGVAGEPGLDGLPGRSGNDGVPGEDGKPGLNGIPGAPGRNGTDGRNGYPGAQGPQGPPGIPGKMGLRGPPGQDGRPGQDGKPGLPGIVSYSPLRSNSSQLSLDTGDLLVPPSIVSGGQYVVAEEGLNVRLDCFAVGKPTPAVQWHRPDGLLIHTGFWHASAVYGSPLNLSSVHRDDMGNYTCTADNGIPPSATKRYKLSVKFGPLIRIRAPSVRARSHGTVVLECEVEAFPKPELYWEFRDIRIENKQDKYRIQEDDYRRDYKFKMRLKISKIAASDYGVYYCVAKKTSSVTKGIITMRDVNDKTTTSEPKGVAVFGKPPPPRPQYRNLCPPQLNCDSCPRANCGYMGVEAKPMTGINFTGMPPRVADGVIGAVGKPVFKGQMDDLYGIWMQDASPKSQSTAGKLWVTRSTDTSHVFEYADVDDYAQKKTPRSIKLPYNFQGNGHLVNDGYFFYNPHNRSSIVRLDLTHNEGTIYAFGRLEMELPGLRVNTGNYLYTPNHNFNYVDFDVDENGLWAIYGTATNSTVVMKVDPDTMTPQYAWGISVDHHKYGEMFVSRGVLYAVHSITDSTMNISLAIDLYQGKHLSVNLSFLNAYKKVTMLRYNNKTKELYAWDNSTLLAYQFLFKDPDDAGAEPKDSSAKDRPEQYNA